MTKRERNRAIKRKKNVKENVIFSENGFNTQDYPIVKMYNDDADYVTYKQKHITDKSILNIHEFLKDTSYKFAKLIGNEEWAIRLMNRFLEGTKELVCLVWEYNNDFNSIPEDKKDKVLQFEIPIAVKNYKGLEEEINYEFSKITGFIVKNTQLWYRYLD
jgi:hypothetical protein